MKTKMIRKDNKNVNFSPDQRVV